MSQPALPPILTDRSRFQCFLDCGRRRFWNYEWDRDEEAGLPGGVVPEALNIPLATGIYTHLGVARLLEQAAPRWGELPSDELQALVEEAVHLACSACVQEVHSRGLACEQPAADPPFTAREQEALIEALVRAYAVDRLPVLLADHEVLEVEREYLLPLGQVGDRELIWQSRSDALLKRRDSGDLYVLSLKTLNEWDRRQEQSNKHDVQGLSEAAAVEHYLDQEYQKQAQEISFLAIGLSKQLAMQDFLEIDAQFAEFQALRREHLRAPSRVEGILMQFLLKGRRFQQGSTPFDQNGEPGGKWEQHCPLIRARRKEMSDPVTGELTYQYAWTSSWQCSQPHPVRRSKWYPDGLCPGDGRRHRLGEDWEVFYVWEQTDPFRVWTPVGVRQFPPGVRGWLEALQTDAVQPEAGPCLPTQFLTPEPYRRQQQDLDEWRRQAAWQEDTVWLQADLIRHPFEGADIDALLDQHFPKNRRACDYPTACPYIPLCHEMTVPASQIDPLDLGPYQRRQPHHQPELDAFRVLEPAL